MSATQRTKIIFYADKWQVEELKRNKEIDGISQSEQMRRALTVYLTKKERDRQSVSERAEP